MKIESTEVLDYAPYLETAYRLDSTALDAARPKEMYGENTWVGQADFIIKSHGKSGRLMVVKCEDQEIGFFFAAEDSHLHLLDGFFLYPAYRKEPYQTLFYSEIRKYIGIKFYICVLFKKNILQREELQKLGFQYFSEFALNNGKDEFINFKIN